MVTSAVEDPIRAEVERWLHAAVGATIAAPAAIVRGTGRCIVRRVGAVRDRVLQPVRLVRSFVDLAGGSVPRPTADTGRAARPVAGAPPVEAPVAIATPAIVASSLPIDEYESLAASHVVARLPSLTPAELDAVRRFEADHRGRRTILGRIDQLLAPA